LFFWREFFADFGALGPLPELLFFVDLGVGFFKGEPLVFEVEALGVEFRAAEAGDIGTELAEATPMGLGIILECGEGVSCGGVLEDEPALEFVGGEFREWFHAVGGFGFEAAEKFDGVLTGLPVAEAALAPF
jgi:hypothetical protein